MLESQYMLLYNFLMLNYQKQLENYISSTDSGARLALHSCCGPCSSYVLEYLSGHFDVTVFFYNPNIHPLQEYKLRLEQQQKLCGIMGIELVECDYDLETFLQYVRGTENEPEGAERCSLCFELRLENTARLAAESGFGLITTTLTVSPHKNAVIINEIGEKAAKKYGLEWLPCDFKKRGGYQRSVQLSRRYDLYRQNYCGCVFSMRKDNENGQR